MVEGCDLPIEQGSSAVNLDTLKAIARELDSLDLDDATSTEKNIAQLLINVGLLAIEPMTAEALGSMPEQNWKEFKAAC